MLIELCIPHSPKMANWQQLPNDVVKVVLSQPGVSCDVKRVIGKEMGWNLIGRVHVPPSLEQKLNRIILARKPVSELYGLRTCVFGIRSDDSKVSLQVYYLRETPIKLGYKIAVKKNKRTKEYVVIHDDSSCKWIVWQTFSSN